MEPNVVTKVVTDEVGITAKVINGLENFAFNRGIDLLEAIIIFIVGYVICRYIRQGIIKILEKGKLDPSARSFVSEIAFFFCLAIVTIIALSTAGVAAGTLAAAFGGIGLAIGLGIKDNIGNVASGIFILIFRPFSVGDYIAVGTNQGTVVDIRIMYTEISTMGNQMIVIPNSSLTNSVIMNYSSFNTRNLQFNIGVGYGTDLAHCIELLKEVFHENKYVMNKDDIAIYVNGLGDSSINIYIRATVLSEDYFTAQNELYIAIKKKLDDAGIDIPFPQVVVHQAKD